jgi:hypothetical protein
VDKNEAIVQNVPSLETLPITFFHSLNQRYLALWQKLRY